MADKKIAASLVNVIKFDIDRASMQRAMKAIKDVKKAMEGVYKPFIDAQKHMKKAQAIQAKSLKQKSDSLIVQKALDKRETAQLKQAEKLANIKIKQAAAEKKMHQEARKNAIAGLTGSGGSKASGTALADLLRQEDAAYRARRRSVLDARASANKARQQRKNMEMGLMHSEGLYMNRMFDRQQKQSAASNNTANKFTSRREADQFFFRNKFGRGGERRFNQLAQEFSAGGMSPQMYASKLRILRSELYANQRAQRGFNDSIRDMRSAFIAATASYTAFAGVMGIANVGKKYQGYQSAMTMAFGSQQEAANQTQFAMNETYRLGLSPSEAMDNYSKLAVASKGKISTNDLQGLFSGYSEYAKVAGASQERISNGVVAMQQMLSKGRITAEEFRSQMAEQVVGSDVAFRKAVEEMIGRALKEGELEKMMEKGLLDPDVLLPKVGKYFSELARAGGALEIKLNQLETIEMRMKMRWEQIQKTVYETGSESGLKGLYKTLDQIFKMMMDQKLVGGGFLKGFLDSATKSLEFLWNRLQDIQLFLKYELGIDGVNGEMLGKAAYWVSIAASIQVIAKAFSMIFGGSLLGNLVAFLSGGLGKAVTDSTEAASKTGVIAKAGGLLGKALGIGMAAELGLALGDWMRNTFPMVKDFGDSLGTYLAKLTTGFGNEQNQQILSGAVGSMQGAGFNAAWANSMPLFMQNQQPQKVEIIVDKAQGLENYVELKINERDQRKIAEILPTSFGTPPKF